jgi:hypothetical protein
MEVQNTVWCPIQDNAKNTTAGLNPLDSMTSIHYALPLTLNTTYHMLLQQQCNHFCS